MNINLLAFSSKMVVDEICNNGIDDDNDGLIDLNDEDCECLGTIPTSLIPNPSFEDMTCCPTDENQLECAVSWIQASAATSDYLHSCGILSHPYLGYNTPLPIPDGEGFIGFRDGKPFNSQFKEYVGACLNATMEVGVDYTLDFFLGFPSSNDFNYLDMSIYATTNCNNLPFGGSNSSIGCPTNSNGWVQIAQKKVTGNNEWVNVVFEFTADAPYQAIILGSGCDVHDDFSSDPYFYMDRLALAKSSDFEFPFAEINGNPCSEVLSLTASQDINYTYQWFKNGIALVGFENEQIDIVVDESNEGEYSVMVSFDGGCFLSEKYNLIIPEYFTTTSETICEGQEFKIGGDVLTEEGAYVYQLTSVQGCDSTVNLSLSLLPNSSAQIEAIICEGDSYTLNNEDFKESGIYEVVIPSANNCDSTITLTLDVFDPVDGLVLPSDTIINLGDKIDLKPTFVNPLFVDFEWLNVNNQVLSNTLELLDYLPLVESTVILRGYDVNGCYDETLITIRIARNIGIFYPNIFSPNDDNVNDVFKITANKSIAGLQDIKLYDRWGNLVYNEYSVANIHEMVGWDGRYKNQAVVPGVYVFVAKLVALDGIIETVFGDVTVVR
ncbi:MAG: gliding motility-associated C-terminal domain-containing protein [Saprospiraceae bacterium]